MGETRVVEGSRIHASLDGYYVTEDAVPLIKELIGRARPRSASFWGRQWSYEDAGTARAEIVKLLSTMNDRCTPTFFLQSAPRKGAASVITKEAASATRRHLDIVGDSYYYTTTTIAEASRQLGIWQENGYSYLGRYVGDRGREAYCFVPAPAVILCREARRLAEAIILQCTEAPVHAY